MQKFLFFTHNIFMKKIDREYKKVLNKLTYAEPQEVGAILKEYFYLRRKNKK